MHGLKVLIASSTVALATAAFAQTEPTVPAAGEWQITTVLKGTPRGDQTVEKKACITAAQIAAGPEQALMQASAGAEGPPKGAPKCTLSNIKKEGAKASWQSTCEGPRGPMQGTGTSTLQEKAAQLQQEFTLKMPFGSVKLNQTIQAKHLGACTG